ncbi:MAG: hypothetical protein Q9220_007521 [cf. Caloplaca sp. 1 TL-2023]
MDQSLFSNYCMQYSDDSSPPPIVPSPSHSSEIDYSTFLQTMEHQAVYRGAIERKKFVLTAIQVVQEHITVQSACRLAKGDQLKDRQAPSIEFYIAITDNAISKMDEHFDQLHRVDEILKSERETAEQDLKRQEEDLKRQEDRNQAEWTLYRPRRGPEPEKKPLESTGQKERDIEAIKEAESHSESIRKQNREILIKLRGMSEYLKVDRFRRTVQKILANTRS